MERPTGIGTGLNAGMPIAGAQNTGAEAGAEPKHRQAEGTAHPAAASDGAEMAREPEERTGNLRTGVHMDEEYTP